jgi:hypothetical protein
MVRAARRRIRYLEQSGDGCWVNARGCLAIRYSGVMASRMQQRSSFPRIHNRLHLSRATRLVPIDQTATINKFQILKRSLVWSRFGQLPTSSSQPLSNHPNLSVPISSCTTTFFSTCTLSQLSLSPRHATLCIPNILSLTLGVIAHSTPTRCSCS